MTTRKLLTLIIIICIPLISCSGDEPLFSSDIILNEYSNVAGPIVERDPAALLEFSAHEDKYVRSLSWRAISKTVISEPDSLLGNVLDLNEEAAWFGLSYHTLSEESLQKIRDLFTSAPDRYKFACEIFKRQGSEKDLLVLLEVLTDMEDTGGCAVAAGRLLTTDTFSESTVNKVIDTAFGVKSATVRRNLLYGMYRSPLNRPESGRGIWNRLFDQWVALGIGSEPATDQYMIGILGSDGTHRFLESVSFPAEVEDQQLIIEIIRSLDVEEDLWASHQQMILDLLAHQNPTVVTEMLERLKLVSSLAEPLRDHIYSHHVQRTRNDVVFVTAMELLLAHGVDVGSVNEKLAYIENRNPYLTNRILNLHRELSPVDSLFANIGRQMRQGGIRGLHASQVLSDFWITMDNDSQVEKVRGLMREAAEIRDASVVSGLSTLLADDELVRQDDSQWLEEQYRTALSAQNRVATQTFAQALEARFPDQYSDLEVIEAEPFRFPDWEQLHDLGTKPHWHLETEKGSVVIRLNPLSAPFTVSSIDSLTRAGAYDGVAFHRVVHNFVIQGGDVGRGDGFGGPGYRIPTEPSLLSFERGAAGIASSGTDTEGSQYFMMHQWKPHLDGDYTRFGTVVRGMDVVDRIQMGDLVIKATIRPI